MCGKESGMTEYSPQQKLAMLKIKTWLSDKNRKQVFKMFGYAGTGKTFLISKILEIVDNVIFATYTGKAAHVLRTKGVPASTIHSLIYKLVDDEKGKLTWEINPDSKIRYCKLIIIDEVSMVNEEMARDLMSFKKPILVVGDPGQLPPVSGTGFFIQGEPNVMLTEIHRQAKDSPIIQLATAVRMGLDLDFGNYDTSRVIRRKDLKAEDILNADQILVGKNDTRISFNHRIRELLKFEDPNPVYGDKLICLRNNKELGILNGSMWYVNENKQTPRISNLIIRDEFEEYNTRKVSIPIEFWTGNEAKLEYDFKRRHQEFTYGYAITAHKSQGSQWNNVLIFDESFVFRDDAKKWLYTATTRASDKVTIVI